MSLNDLQVKNAKPGKKPFKLFDGDGLFLLVTPQGGKYWRIKYRFDGKEKLLALGVYPEVPLRGHYLEDMGSKTWIDGARDLCAKARKQIAAGIDPGAARRAFKAAKASAADDSFEVVAREWLGNHREKCSPEHIENIKNRLEKDVFPWIGAKPITEVTAKEIKSVLDRVKSRGVVETARRVRTIVSQVFVYAISTDRANHDIAASLRSYLPPSSRTKKHMAAVTDTKELAELLKAIDGYQGSFIVKCALQLLPLVFVRPGELRHAEWEEINFEEEKWCIPAEKMKMKLPHIVPLSRQALAILKELQPLTGSGRYLFPSTRTAARCMSDNTINAAFRRMGFDKETITGHGFRATARTLLDEVLGQRVDFIEHQLAHAVRDPNGRAYNRTAHLADRQKMMQHWADFLEDLKCNTAKSRWIMTTLPSRCAGQPSGMR